MKKDKSLLNKVKKKIGTKSTAVIVVMLCLLSIGVISSLSVFSSASSSSGGQISQRPVISPGIVLDDGVLTSDEAIANLKNKVMYTPASANVLNDFTFSENKTDVYKFLREQNGLRLDSGYEGVLNVSTLDDYLKVCSNTSTPSGFSLGFYITQLAHYANGSDGLSKVTLSYYDYLTIDFDVWTDSVFFDSMKFQFVGFDSEGERVVAEQPTLYLSGNDSNIPYSNPKIPFHVTFVIKTASDPLDGSTVLMYLDGKLFAETSEGLTNIDNLYYLNLWFERGTIISDRSVCFDNLQIHGFGRGANVYTGSLCELFADGGDGIKLQTIEDSVIYIDNAKSEE